LSEFPIDVHLEDIFAAVNTLDTVILKAEPGVGKTTRLPLYLLKNTNKKILVVEPRRVAAKLPATYLAECIGESVGDTIGYKVRFDNKVTPDSRLVFMTDGMFVKHLNDPEFLDGFEYVIFDEFHERTLNNDLGLALVENHREKMRSNEMRPLKLVIMSATLDTDLMKDLYPSAKVFELKGEMFGVDVSYLPREEKEFCENHVVRAVKSLESNQRIKGNVLVFLTGKAEISKTCHQLAQSFGAKYEVIPFMSETAAKSLKKINNA
jgi:ATP-dependent helicase HrpB